MFELFRSQEILPDGRTNEDEANLIQNAEGEHRTLNIELRSPEQTSCKPLMNANER
jgi:hypothetical protein